MVFNNPVLYMDVYGLSDALNPENMKKWAGAIAIQSGTDLAGVGCLIAIAGISAGVATGDLELTTGGVVGGLLFISVGGVLVWAGIKILKDGCGGEMILKPSNSYPQGSYPNNTNFHA